MHKDNMSSKAVGNPVKVEVHAAIDRLTKKVTFTDEWEADWANGKQKGDITVPYGTPPTEIQFHLRDDTGLHLNFMRAFADVIYVGTGDECPPPRGNAGGQISFVSSTPNLLKIINANSGGACNLKYALRFNGQDNAAGSEHQPYVFDPDLKNGGGGIPPKNDSSVVALLLGAGAVALLGYLAYEAFFE